MVKSLEFLSEVENMLLKDYPEYFASYKIYEIIRNTMRRYAREQDIEKMLNDMAAKDTTPENFLRQLGLVSKRHMNIDKSSKMIMEITENIGKMIGYSIEPKELVLTKEGRAVLKVMVENKTDATLKFRVGVQQFDREYTAIIFNPVKNYSLTKLIKSSIIDPGKVHAFNFIIKPDVFGVDDLYELKKNNKIRFMIGMQIAIEGVEGMKTRILKLPVDIVKHKA
jgi:hypothetical protein